MYKSSYLKIVVIIAFVLIAGGIGYIGWKNWNRSNEAKNRGSNLDQQQDRQAKLAEDKDSEIPRFDASGWKIYRNEWQIEEIQVYPFTITVGLPKHPSSALFIDPINVGRESVFDTGSRVNLHSIDFFGKYAKQYICPGENTCPLQIAHSKAIHLIDLPQGYENDYQIVEQILSTFRFTK
jgi:hypothetical protein